MTDFKSLDPVTRTYALVGCFLQAWSAMELALHDAIGAALEIEATKLWILCANLRFQDKTNILRTLVDVSAFPEEEKQLAKKKIRKLSAHSGRRNMVAHDPFQADTKGGGVSFITVKAKGDFDTPQSVWSLHRFEEEERLIYGYMKFLECLTERFKQKPLQHRNFVDALRPFLWDPPQISGVPMQRTASPALMHYLSHQAPAHPDSDQTSPETDAQTPGGDIP